MKATKKKPPAPISEWLVSASQKKRRCCMCRDPGKAALDELLKAILEAKAFGISAPKIYDRLCSTVDGFQGRVGYHSMRVHLAEHEPIWAARFAGKKST